MATCEKTIKVMQSGQICVIIITTYCYLLLSVHVIIFNMVDIKDKISACAMEGPLVLMMPLSAFRTPQGQTAQVKCKWTGGWCK